MIKIILDTNIILRYPKFLGLIIPNTEFIVPSSVSEEIFQRSENNGKTYGRRVDLLYKAALQKIVTIIEYDKVFPNIEIDQNLVIKLGKTDATILALAIALKANNDDTIHIATSDRELASIALEHQIDVINAEEIRKLLDKFSITNKSPESVQVTIVKYQKNENFHRALAIGVGFGLAFFIYLIFSNLTFILEKLQLWTIPIILIFGILLFLLREKRRLAYGVLEVLFGCGCTWLLLTQESFDYAVASGNIDFLIKIMAGLYVIVRGLDNIVKSQDKEPFGSMLRDKYKIG